MCDSQQEGNSSIGGASAASKHVQPKYVLQEYFDIVARARDALMTENASLKRSLEVAYVEVDRMRGMLDREIGRDTTAARNVVSDTRPQMRAAKHREFRDAAIKRYDNDVAAPAEVDAAERESLGYRMEDLENKVREISTRWHPRSEIMNRIGSLEKECASIRESIQSVDAMASSRIQQLEQQLRTTADAVLAGVKQILDPVNNDIKILGARTEEIRTKLETHQEWIAHLRNPNVSSRPLSS